ncbi:unnamed protein product [Strongylus vulgaris]|uniref:Uncharacterized protein n=1 Tax=Strongylus vulgaris TaxID=40348 RepID=A0A3P7J2R7_STRVU|nr:unnamed protein product [Strongylus vulgaris]
MTDICNIVYIYFSGQTKEAARAEYVEFAEEMILWSVDY